MNGGEDPVELLIVDPHAFDSQIGKVVPVMANGQVIGHARLTRVTYTEEDGWRYELTTVPADEPEAVTVADREHVHHWREIMWRPSGRGRPADPRPHLVCDDDCPVINDVERYGNVGDPIDLLFEDDPRSAP